MAVVAKQIVVGVDDDFQVRESIEPLVESAGFAPLVFSFAEEPPESGVIAKARRALDDGAKDFLYKPFEATELLFSIERALQQSDS